MHKFTIHDDVFLESGINTSGFRTTSNPLFTATTVGVFSISFALGNVGNCGDIPFSSCFLKILYSLSYSAASSFSISCSCLRISSCDFSDDFFSGDFSGDFFSGVLPRDFTAFLIALLISSFISVSLVLISGRSFASASTVSSAAFSCLSSITSGDSICFAASAIFCSDSAICFSNSVISFSNSAISLPFVSTNFNSRGFGST